MIDIRGYSYSEWIHFIFDRSQPISHQEGINGEPWEIDENNGIYSWNSNETLQHSIRVFTNISEFSGSFTQWQIRQGLNVIRTTFLPDIGDREHGIDAICCIYAMHSLFRDYFVIDPNNAVCSRWFDGWPTCKHSSEHDPLTKNYCLKLNHAVIDVEEAALQINSIQCQKAALNGLQKNHICDRACTVIEMFLATNLAMDPKLREYAILCKERKKGQKGQES